ncbi:MAG: hypothetical protein DME32_03965 [Verrucomicrobia bacterium]|nr:MAG: hypothetical protein DME32_03965 [Verrucomicrobiota bacterium]
MSEPTRTDGQARGGGTGGRSDRDDETAVSLKSFSPRSEEKIRTDAEARNNESPPLQAEQHWESCDCTGSPPPQCPGSPGKCLQQLIGCAGGCTSLAPRTGRVTAKMDNATIRTKQQRDNPVITNLTVTLRIKRSNDAAAINKVFEPQTVE